MTDPRLSATASRRLEAEVRHLHTAARPLNSAPQEPNRDPDDHVQTPNSAHLDESLVELGTRFAGLIRVLDDIRQVSEGLPDFDVDSMTRPVVAVLKGVMGRIISAPATTIVDLGIKAQVVMWANQDWWDDDAKPSWQTVATRALVEQTIAAAGLNPPMASGLRPARDTTG
jgi:hypothetical protein